MARYKDLKTKYQGFICRSCINDIYLANLKQKDCLYDSPYIAECPRCKEGRHLVSELQTSGKVKLMFKS